jgi:biotin transport system substrate-specific component
MRITPRHMILSCLFTALTAAGALISFPLPPFPGKVTLQIFVLVLCARVLPPFPAFLSVLAYLLLGLAGVPILSMGGGLQYVLQPTFGYLAGFLAGAPLASALYRTRALRMRPVLRVVVPGAVFLLCTYGLGVPWLGFVMNGVMHAQMPWTRIIVTGCLLFLPIDAVKVALAEPAARFIERLAGRGNLSGRP